MVNTSNTDDETFDAQAALDQSRKLAERLGLNDNKWFGMNMDADVRNVIGPVYLSVVSGFNAAYGPIIERFFADSLANFAAKGMNPATSKLANLPLFGRMTKAATSPKGLTVALFGLFAAGPLIPSLLSPLFTWYKERADMAKTCAPILKEMKEEGLSGSIGNIGAQDNEILYAHRMRVNGNFSHFTYMNLLGLASSQTSTLINNGTGNSAKKSTKAPSTTPPPSDGAIHPLAATIHTLPGIVDVLVGKYKASINKEFASSRNSCSAYTLITHLDEQVKKAASSGANISGGDFSFPKIMGNRSTNLAGYIATLIKAHGDDMAHLMPDDYSALRPALNSQLAEVSKVLAEAMISGDLAALSLVRLLGEGHIIKQQGRNLVDAAVLKSELHKHAGKQVSVVEVDAKEYFKMAAFKDKELQEMLGRLEGTERGVFASFFPDSVLKRIGVSEKEIRDIREETAPMYEKNLAALILGITAQDPAELKKQGIAADELKVLQEAAKKLQQHGEEAVHALRANAMNPTGIELTAMNAAESLIQGGSVHLGMLITDGKKILAQAANDDHAAEGKGKGEHTRRIDHGEDAYAERGRHTRQHVRHRADHDDRDAVGREDFSRG